MTCTDMLIPRSKIIKKSRQTMDPKSILKSNFEKSKMQRDTVVHLKTNETTRPIHDERDTAGNVTVPPPCRISRIT